MNSGRVPGKVLARIRDITMVEHVYRRVRVAGSIMGAASVHIAVDNEEVEDACTKFNASTIMTPTFLNCGSERVALAAFQLHAEGRIGNDDIVINIQADKPFVDPLAIVELNKCALRSVSHTSMMFALREPITEEQRADTDVVKVMVDDCDRAIMFTRKSYSYADKHSGIYAYRLPTLLQVYMNYMAGQSVHELEESLEQMRAIARGVPVYCAMLPEGISAGLSVNSFAHLREANRIPRATC